MADFAVGDAANRTYDNGNGGVDFHTRESTLRDQFAQAEAAPQGGTQAGPAPQGGTQAGPAPQGGTQAGPAPQGGTQAGPAPQGGTQAGPAPQGGTQAGPAPQNGTQQAAPEDKKSCAVVSGPSYTPGGPYKPLMSTWTQYAPFQMDAKFAKDDKHDPSCCVVHQDLSVNQRFLDVAGGPPHEGFPKTMAAGVYYEDTDSTGTNHYGDRNNPSSISQYIDTKTGLTDQQHGDAFHGVDTPQSPTKEFGHDMTTTRVGKTQDGTWDFRLRVTDRCNGDAPVAPAPDAKPTTTILWGRK